MKQLKVEVAALKADVAELNAEFHAFRDESAQRHDSLDARLEWLAASAMEHGAAIMQLKRRQA